MCTNNADEGGLDFLLFHAAACILDSQMNRAKLGGQNLPRLRLLRWVDQSKFMQLCLATLSSLRSTL